MLFKSSSTSIKVQTYSKLLLWVSLIGTLLLIIFFTQTKVFSQNAAKHTESMSGGNTAVIFPANKIANITNLTPTEINSTIPNNTINGDVYVERDALSSNPISFTVGSSFVPDDSGEAMTWTTTTSGAITNDTIWDSDILITGDVTINAGVTLTITPGVTVFFAASSDDTAGGFWTDRSELHVYGTLYAVGTEISPIYFTSNATTPASGDWGSIVIRKDSAESILSNCVVHYAEQGTRFWAFDEGAGNLGGTINQCAIFENNIGIYVLGDPEYPLGGTMNIDVTLTNNYIANNVNYGIYLRPRTGYGTVNFDSTIENNLIEQNPYGIYQVTGSWWLGHVDVRTIIRNNTIVDNTNTGLYIEATGSSDSSGSDTDVQPVIEHNLIQNNANNIHLHLDPYGADGTQLLNPMIRYNSIGGGLNGILLDETQTYDTFNPTITQNVFLGSEETGAIFVNNQSSRTITVDGNYWGNNDAAWDAGPQPGDTSGTVTINSFLTSASTPLLTRLKSAVGQPGDLVTLYGANFGESYIRYLFLPLIINNQPAPNFEPIFIGNTIPQRNANPPGEVFYSTTIQLPTGLPTTGHFYLSAESESLSETVVDDEIVLKNGSSIIYTHDYSAGGSAQPAIVPIPRVIMETMSEQTITVEYHDVYGSVVSASEMWLIWVP